MVFKLTGSDSWFQCKNRFGKICTESWDIGKKVSKYAGLVWQPGFWHILIHISGPGAYFSKPIFALKPWAQAGRFELHEAYIRKNFFFNYLGVLKFLCAISAVGKTPIGLEFIRISSHTSKNIQEGIAEIIFQDIDILSHPSSRWLLLQYDYHS